MQVIQTSRKTQGRFDSAEQEAFLNLWRTYDRLKTLEEELFGRYGLTAQQYNALRLLRAASPEKVATLALAGRLVSLAPDITRLLDRLYARGLIERERRDDDRRSVYVGITEDGLSLLDDLYDEVCRCHRMQLGHLTSEELKALTDLLREARAPHEHEGSIWG